MNKGGKLFATILVTFTMAFAPMTMTACSPEEPAKNPIENSQPMEKPDEKPGENGQEQEKPDEKPSQTVEQKVQAIQAKISEASDGKNFSVLVEHGDETTIYLYDGDNIAIDKDEVYTTAGDKTYHYYLENGGWIREEVEGYDDQIGDMLKNYKIDSYYEFSDSFGGSYKNNGISIFPTSTGFYFVTGTNPNPTFWRFGDIGKTQASAPSVWTEKQPDTPTPPDQPIEEEYIINKDGSYNIALIKNVLTNWMQGDNQFGKDVLKAKYNNGKTEQLLYVNVGDYLEFGLS